MTNISYVDRDAQICQLYKDGESLVAIGKRFSLSRARVQQILRREGVWKRHQRTDRDQVVGVRVKVQTKERLRDQAAERGISIAKHASDVLDSATHSDDDVLKVSTSGSC